MPSLTGKKVLLVIAHRNFQDEEFSRPYEALQKSGAAVTIASSEKNPATGMFGKSVTPQALLGECQAADYDAVVFIGGSGADEYWNNPTAHALAKATVAADKLLAAICIAPVTLANAGVLKGKKATCFPSVENALSKQGARVTRQNVVQDGRIITAPGPAAAQEFAAALVRSLSEKATP